MTYYILVDDRKAVVKKLEELAGKRAEYTRVPRMAYIVDGIAVEKNGTVTTQENARADLIEALIADHLIKAEESEVPEEGQEETESTEAQTDEVEPTEDIEETAAPDERIEVSEHEEEVNSVEISGMQEEDEHVPTSYEDLVEPETETRELIKPNISFPMYQHRAESIINLVCTIYSRGKLLTKATGGMFYARQDLVDRLEQLSGHIRMEDVLRIIEEMGGIQGISFTENKVIFDGFPATADADVIKAWTALSTAINKNTIKQMHVRAKDVDDTNERFAFRTWLTRLGMNGADLRTERNILYRNLSGHTAFRTAQDEERWKTKQAAKRARLKAMKADAEAESEENGAGE